MYLVSFHEQTIQIPLHKKSGGKFEHYVATTNSAKEITGMKQANAEHTVTIYGYCGDVSGISANIYKDQYFCVTEIKDDLYEHLMAEWGTAHVWLRNGLVFGAKTQVEAVAEAKSKLANGGVRQINTGARPMAINDSLLSFPKAINDKSNPRPIELVTM